MIIRGVAENLRAPPRVLRRDWGLVAVSAVAAVSSIVVDAILRAYLFARPMPFEEYLEFLRGPGVVSPLAP